MRTRLFGRSDACKLEGFAAMQSPLPAPTATGAFTKTPFCHLLVYALERRLTGTFELSHDGIATATLLVMNGCPAKVRTSAPIHHLGTVMAELGLIRPADLQTSLARMQESPRLQGQILLEMGATDPVRLDAGLRSQVERKVEHLFSLPNASSFAYYDGLDLLRRYGGPPTPIDPFPVLWRGVRDAPTWEHVDATLRRVGAAFLRASATAELDRFAFNGHELEAIELIRQRSARVLDVASILGPGLGQVLVYFLVIMKQVELLDAPAAAQAPSGQAFARVQLQRQASRTPLVVEEHVAASGANDERASSPGMNVASAFAKAPPSAFTAPGAPHELDIGSLISQTIQRSSLPPSLPDMAPPNVPTSSSAPRADSTPPPSGSGSIHADPSSSRPLTAEQAAIRAKILERAEQITSQDYFQMLGLEHDATPEEVQKTFFGLAKAWHPDRLPPALADVKDACSKVFTHLTAAHATLMDSTKRQDYMTLLKDGGATPEDQEKIQAILEAATEFQKAEILLKRSQSDPQAYEIVKRCASLDPEQADYVATLAWLDAQRPEWFSREKTLEKVTLLDRCIQKSPSCERAYFYRGMLYKRIDEPVKALKDFKAAAELNPRNLDAMREVRLHNIRGGASRPPPGARSNSNPPPETLGGLFGKLFKK